MERRVQTPATACGLRDLLEARARNRNVQDDEFADVAGMSAGVSVSDGAAPIMADDENLLETKLAHELVNVGRDGALVITGRGLGRVAESAHVRCDHRIPLGERRDNEAPSVPRLRPSLEQDDG